MRNCLRPLMLLGLGLVSTASAGEIGYRAQTPSQSPFEVVGSEIPTPQHSSLEYRGRATIRARYRFAYDPDVGEGRRLHLDLLPDADSLSRLPYLTRWANESLTSPNKVMVTDTAKEIWVTNVGDAAVALLGEELASEAMAGNYENISGDALIVIDGFLADYTCTRPVFSTQFVKVETAISAPSPTKLRLVSR